MSKSAFFEHLLLEELKLSPYPRSGPRSQIMPEACRCGGWCKGHGTSCRFNFAIEYYTGEYITMARKKSGKTPTFNTTFVRCDLTTADKDKFKTWLKTKDLDTTGMMNDMLQTNHKISFSYSEHNDSYICSVTGKPDDCDNAGKCYTSHAKDVTTALNLAIYKFHVIFKAEAWEDIGEDADFG